MKQKNTEGREFITESGNYKLISKVTKELAKPGVIIVINNDSQKFVL